MTDSLQGFSLTVQRVLDNKEGGVFSIGPDRSAVDAALILSENNIGILVCVDEAGGIAGVISERDIVRAFCTHAHRVPEVLVHELMTEKVNVCSGSDNLHDVLKAMQAGKYRHTPVVEDGKLSGMISITDILRFYTGSSYPIDRQTVMDILFSGSAVYPGG